MPVSGGPMFMFEYQNLDYDTTATANPIVINTWYTALATTRNVKSYYLIVEQTNNGATVEDIEVELTIDGTVYVAATAMNSGALYYANFGIAATFGMTGIVNQLLALDADQSAPLETKSLQIRVRQTSVVDLVTAQIEVNMVYETLEMSS